MNSCQQNNAAASKKRPLLMDDADDDASETIKRNKRSQLIDLTDVPPQLPIMSSKRRGSSKYQGVSYWKTRNKWRAKITIDGKSYFIGYYENEEEAAIDYARAVFKYRCRSVGQKAKKNESLFCSTKGCPHEKAANGKFCYSCDGILCHDVPLPPQSKPKDCKIADCNEVNPCQQNDAAASKKRPILLLMGDADDASETTKRQKKVIDLTDVPPQLPILKGNGNSGTSKYKGVCFQKAKNKWHAQITIDGTSRHIGLYENEEEAAVDYARAALKYRSVGQKVIDLTDVPPQLPILKGNGSGRSGTSKYKGVCFQKAKNKWHAQITIDGTSRHIGVYENEEEAAVDYARAAFKYTSASSTCNHTHDRR